ncbi:unnamed protein product [Symbiodinium natans]|uniref:Reverse transcriptase domain-containing protein n=1 Tax=Symbiodinium natans TaxID=878477 RepID=A0A812KK06_9DINO|nr:unnamed protein product [Symbiodinium natans]
MLNAQQPAAWVTWDPLLGLKAPARTVIWKGRRGAWFRRRMRRWSGWPYRGKRVGEASNPGPEPGTPVGGERPPRERSPPRAGSAPGPAAAAQPAARVASAKAVGRVYCPVSICPCSDAARARGWANVAAMRSHIDAHLAGAAGGEVPQAWLQANGRTRCLVCGLSVSEKFGIHPTCRPAARAAAVAEGDPMDTDDLDLPSFEAIQAARTATLRHVPAKARHLWNQLLARALAAVAHRNDEEAWRELLMLPQSVLCAPARRGKKHARAVAAFVLDRMQRWQEGERRSLWDTRPQHRQRCSAVPTPEERRGLAEAWGREGFDRKACAALLSKGLCPDNAETARALELLHPQRAPPAARPPQELPLAPEVAAEVVARCLRAFPAETAPGPTGLRVQHLRDACIAGGHEAFLSQLTAVVNVLAQGRAPPSVAPVLAGAGLVALPKASGGVRPIAVGELLRRLTGKCLMSLVRDEARAYFWPAQVGVAVKGGAEKAVHVLRAWTNRHAGSSRKVLVKLDFANAFNCVHRDTVLDETTNRFPALARWVTWCYRQHTRLQFGARTLESCSGVQQGDPLGPLPTLDIAMHFLDDGVLAGDIAAVSAALTLVQQQASAIGLQLNLRKCEVVALGPIDEGIMRASFPAALLLHADGSGRVLRNFEFLGAAIGDDDFIQTHTLARAEKAGELLEALAELEDPQVGLRLLRACAGFCRMVHSMRCNPPAAQAAALAHFDGLVRRCLGGLTGIHVTAEQWLQASRGLAHAGLGLRSCSAHAPAAYLASVGASLEHCSDLDPNFSKEAVQTSNHVVGAFHLFQNAVGSRVATLAAALQSKQRDLSQLLDSTCFAAQLEHSSHVARAALHSEAGLGARAFLNAMPSGRTRMEPAAFIAELRIRLGVPEATDDCWCPRCDGVLDCWGYHAGMCVAGGERTLRHNAVRDLVCSWAERAGLRPEKERPNLLLPTCPEDTQTGRRRPADVFLPALAGSPAALDFAVTAPQRQETLALAGRETGAAAAAYARHKEAHLGTAQACEGQGVVFVPMVVESTGTWDKGAGIVLQHIARAVAARTGEEPQRAHSALMQELCVLIRAYRARAALRRRAEAAET